MSKMNCVMGSAEAETKDGVVRLANYARCEWKCIAGLFIVPMKYRIKYEMTNLHECNTLQRTAGSRLKTKRILAVHQSSSGQAPSIKFRTGLKK